MPTQIRSLPVLLVLASCASAPKPTPAPEAAPAPAPVSEPALDRSKTPPPGPPADFRLPVVSRFRLTNGLEVALSERHGLPVVGMTLLVKGAGSSSDEAATAGLASLAVGLLDEGAGGRDAQQLALEIERLGASISAGAGTDAALVSAMGLKRVLDPLLGLFADVVRRPTFPAADLERVRGEALTGLLRERDSGPLMARLIFGQVLFPDHAYGLRRTPESVKAISRDAVVRFYESHFLPARAVLVVSGDVTREELQPRLEQAFGGWTAKGPAVAALPVPAARERVSVSLHDRPGAAQSSIVLGWVGLARANPDYFPALVMNAIFGGLFNSRLNMNLREDKHWSYGARAGFEARQVPGPFTVGTEVQLDHTAEAVAEILKEIARMRDTLPTDGELAAAKNALVRSLPQRFETVGGASSTLAEVMLYDLPADYWETYDEHVRAVTPEQVRDVAQRYLTPDRWTLVVAGDRSVVEAPIKALGLAPEVVVREYDGKPGK